MNMTDSAPASFSTLFYSFLLLGGLGGSGAAMLKKVKKLYIVILTDRGISLVILPSQYLGELSPIGIALVIPSI